MCAFQKARHPLCEAPYDAFCMYTYTYVRSIYFIVATLHWASNDRKRMLLINTELVHITHIHRKRYKLFENMYAHLTTVPMNHMIMINSDWKLRWWLQWRKWFEYNNTISTCDVRKHTAVYIENRLHSIYHWLEFSRISVDDWYIC